MKRHWVEYREQWTREPMSYWVHRQTGDRYEPPLPRPVPGMGYAVYFVQVDDFVFRFASLSELDVCIATLSRKLLPTSWRLSEERGTGYGPNNHWLSRMPKGTKSWRYREMAVRYLQQARESFAHEVKPFNCGMPSSDCGPR